MPLPQLITKYGDGRRVFQLELPPSLEIPDVDAYYACKYNVLGFSRKGIFYLPKGRRNFVGEFKDRIAFIVTDIDGELPPCVFDDGSCLELHRKLTDDEVKTEAELFRRSLGLE